MYITCMYYNYIYYMYDIIYHSYHYKLLSILMRSLDLRYLRCHKHIVQNSDNYIILYYYLLLADDM